MRSDSMASVYSGAGEGRYGTVQVKGAVEFGLQYNYKQGYNQIITDLRNPHKTFIHLSFLYFRALEVHVKQCKDLAAVDTKRNRSDPYVKVRND